MTAARISPSEWVLMGHVSGLYGLHGWVKVFSYTQEREGIVAYHPLYLDIQNTWRTVGIEGGRRHGKGVILKFAGYDDREAACMLLGCNIAVRREQLPPLAPGEYYWTDLQGLRVVNLEDVELGTVERLLETGANEVVVIRGDRERLVPFLQGEVIVEINLDQGVMRVDWDPAF